ncbi:MAG: phage tail tube protein [Armatimonadota bacterium]
MAVALAQEGSFGFGLQAGKGTYEAPTVWLPLIKRSGGRGEEIRLRKNFTLLDLADSNEYESRYYSAGEWAEGEVAVPLIPGSLTELLSWMQDRDSDNQGAWASALIDCVNSVKKLTDAKVRRATISMLKGQPVVCTLDVGALAMEAGTPVTPTMPIEAPYIFREATVEIATGGGGLSADANCERIDIVIDNAIEEMKEGMRLAPGLAPRQMYNLAGVRAWGALSRDFVDSAVYADFASGQEAALSITLTRGVASAVITLPRILYTASDMGLPGTHDQRIVEQVEFVALGSVDGLTPPVTLT